MRNGQASKPASKRGYKGKMEINSRKKRKPNNKPITSTSITFREAAVWDQKAKKELKERRRRGNFSQKLARA